jgi:hypothetical protein
MVDISLSDAERERLLNIVSARDDMTVDEMLREAMGDETPGICLKCEAIIDDIEPDSDDGFCESCGENRVVSIMVLARII